MATRVDSPTVSLSIPAKADYLVLARLALSAVCRLTPLSPDDVADLKLAITESVTGLAGTVTPDPGPGESRRLGFAFHLDEDKLVLEVSGTARPAAASAPGEERELSRAIIEATVDELEETGHGIRMVKYLRPSDE